MNAVVLSLLFLFLATAALWHRERLRANALLRDLRAHQSTLEQQLEGVRAEERERIHADLHDDISAKLLSLIHSSRDPHQVDAAQSILQDLRDIVSHARGAPGTLLEVLGAIRTESTQRMHTLGGQLLWTQAPTLPDSDLAPGHALHLHRIVREAISNAVVHGAANAISIAVDHADYRLHLSIRDDGHGIDTHSPQGRGTRNMRARTASLGGSIEWKASAPSGTEVQLSLPLALESARIPS